MKFLVVLLIFIFKTGFIQAQFFSRDKVCYGDTVFVEIYKGLKQSRVRYKADACYRPSSWGVRLELGVAGYKYDKTISEWIGNKPSFSYGIGAAFKKVNFGFRWKPQIVRPQKEILIGDYMLYSIASIRSVKYDFIVSYSLDFKNLISLEPFLGWTDNRFNLRNPGAFPFVYDIPTASGLMGGLTFNKYLSLGSYEFLALFLRVSYGGNDYAQIHPALEKGYWEGCFGIAYKGFYRHNFLDRVD